MKSQSHHGAPHRYTLSSLCIFSCSLSFFPALTRTKAVSIDFINNEIPITPRSTPQVITHSLAPLHSLTLTSHYSLLVSLTSLTPTHSHSPYPTLAHSFASNYRYRILTQIYYTHALHHVVQRAVQHAAHHAAHHAHEHSQHTTRTHRAMHKTPRNTTLHLTFFS